MNQMTLPRRGAAANASLPPIEQARMMTLAMFPKRGTGAEIGVHKGQFSNLIVRRAKPRKLHLINPWRVFDADLYKQSVRRQDRSARDGRAVSGSVRPIFPADCRRPGRGSSGAQR